MTPTQTNAPYPDGVVEAIEDAAEEVVLDKRVVGRRLFDIEKSVLSGGSSDYLTVVVVATDAIHKVSEPVETDIGTGRIHNVFPREGEVVAVGVKFGEGEVLEEVEG